MEALSRRKYELVHDIPIGLIAARNKSIDGKCESRGRGAKDIKFHAPAVYLMMKTKRHDERRGESDGYFTVRWPIGDRLKN